VRLPHIHDHVPGLRTLSYGRGNPYSPSHEGGHLAPHRLSLCVPVKKLDNDAVGVAHLEGYPLAARVGTAAGTANRAAYHPGHAYDFGLRTILDGLAALITPVDYRGAGA